MMEKYGNTKQDIIIVNESGQEVARVDTASEAMEYIENHPNCRVKSEG